LPWRRARAIRSFLPAAGRDRQAREAHALGLLHHAHDPAVVDAGVGLDHHLRVLVAGEGAAEDVVELGLIRDLLIVDHDVPRGRYTDLQLHGAWSDLLAGARGPVDLQARALGLLLLLGHAL